MKILFLLALVVASSLAYHPVKNIHRLNRSIINVNNSTRIGGGQLATRGQWPFMVKSTAWNNEGAGAGCSASIISPDWVLIAGHCLPDGYNTIDVVLGALNPYDQNEGIHLTSNEHYIHPDYNWPEHDVALIRLPTSVSYSDVIAPISLPDANAGSYAGAAAYAAGWGVDDDNDSGNDQLLKWVPMTIQSNDECSRSWGDVDQYKVCAVGGAGHGGCSGDSGSPLIVNENNHFWAVGVYSFYDGNCAPVAPAGYARISAHRDWIAQITGI